MIKPPSYAARIRRIEQQIEDECDWSRISRMRQEIVRLRLEAIDAGEDVEDDPE